MSDQQPKPIRSAEEVMAEFHKDFTKAQNIAEPIQALKVAAKPAMQAGQEILVGRCPKCQTVAALAGEGKHLCRHPGCMAWLEYVKEG